MMPETPPARRPRLLPALAAVTALVVAGVLVWQLAHLLLLVFGAVLVAVLLRAGTNLICAWTPLGSGVALALTMLAVVLFLLGFVALLGTQIYLQLAQLIERLPALIEAAEAWLGVSGIEEWIAERAAVVIEEASIMVEVAGYGTLIVASLANLVLVLVAGAYMALHPDLYSRGLVMLFPPRQHRRAAETLDAVGDGLRLWLLGQISAMLLVGALSTLGLTLLGVPSALALGFIAGLLEFVPIVGPVLGALPAIAVALGEDPSLALWVLGLYIAIQQIEGMLITPLIQQRAVSLPPALTIFAIVGFGSLFGFPGVLLGTPLAVLSFVLVKKLWVRDTLDEETTLPGEDG